MKILRSRSWRSGLHGEMVTAHIDFTQNEFQQFMGRTSSPSKVSAKDSAAVAFGACKSSMPCKHKAFACLHNGRCESKSYPPRPSGHGTEGEEEEGKMPFACPRCNRKVFFEGLCFTCVDEKLINK